MLHARTHKQNKLQHHAFAMGHVLTTVEEKKMRAKKASFHTESNVSG